MLRYLIKIFLLLGFVTLLAYGCGKKNTLQGIFQKRTPYEAYSNALKEAKLDKTALGKEWIHAGQKIFNDSLYVSLPFSETTYFDATAVMAHGYRFIAEQGQKINISIDILSMEQLHIFLDLFLIEGEPEHVATADTSELVLQYEVKENGEYLLRLQPELLRGGRYTLSITSTPVLAFPVWGKNSNAIASFYGADRDAGRRKHEGVDIFAARGTPVLAAAEGRVGRVNTNRLGGKVVWLRDPERNFSYYYAHLDSQLVKDGEKVNVGDTLGLVGNTGNAITTPPHLHFGIYSFGRGAIDPYSFLHEKYDNVTTTHEGADLISALMRVSASTVNFRLSPDLRSPVVKKLPRHTLLKIQGATGKWLRAETPENLKGFIHFSLVEPIEEPIKNITIEDPEQLYNHPGIKGIQLTNIKPGTTINILAELEDYYYVNTMDNINGWLRKPSL